LKEYKEENLLLIGICQQGNVPFSRNFGFICCRNAMFDDSSPIQTIEPISILLMIFLGNCSKLSG
jgi:hypothetical protein